MKIKEYIDNLLIELGFLTEKASQLTNKLQVYTYDSWHSKNYYNNEMTDLIKEIIKLDTEIKLITEEIHNNLFRPRDEDVIIDDMRRRTTLSSGDYLDILKEELEKNEKKLSEVSDDITIVNSNEKTFRENIDNQLSEINNLINIIKIKIIDIKIWKGNMIFNQDIDARYIQERPRTPISSNPTPKSMRNFKELDVTQSSQIRPILKNSVSELSLQISESNPRQLIQSQSVSQLPKKPIPPSSTNSRNPSTYRRHKGGSSRYTKQNKTCRNKIKNNVKLSTIKIYNKQLRRIGRQYKYKKRSMYNGRIRIFGSKTKQNNRINPRFNL